MSEENTAIACALPPEDLAARRAELRQGLLACVRETRELEDGYVLVLPADAEEQARAFVSFERDCCGFARYAVRREADGVWLEIRGPDGTKEFLRRMLDEAPPAPGARRGWMGIGAGVVALLLCDVPIVLGIAGAASLGFGLELLGGAAIALGVGSLAWARWR